MCRAQASERIRSASSAGSAGTGSGIGSKHSASKDASISLDGNASTADTSERGAKKAPGATQDSFFDSAWEQDTLVL